MRRLGFDLLALCTALAVLGPAPARSDEAPSPPHTHLRIVGGLAGIAQYTRYESPFWTLRLKEKSGGRVTAEVAPFDQSGIQGREMLRLLSLGVISFGTVLPSASTEDPELAALDLPLVSPDFATLRRVVTSYRPQVQRFLHDRYGLELLAVYAYPAQVLYCRQAFRSLGDLRGRRVRTSGVSQAELVEALGGIPVVTPFADIVSAVRRNVVDCAITGTLSGNSIGLHEVTSHVHDMAISWGISLFAANGDAWRALAPPVRELLRREVAGLEAEIWEGAEQETAEGQACNAGMVPCTVGRPGRMTRVPLSSDDIGRRSELIATAILPGWLARCGDACADAWNRSIGPLLSIPAPRE
ncbi:TRAP transporter substrate-binding protein [Azospirillum rugosum]|uniref:TRAP-type C4-dicarboxylate transport system substrate-binding protein n=1 Tax=Azospirillum rugosum TaxID=416170 RepID=A0ABS4SXC9_9PROT|nr:TRAP transporter substrate-binding protein [Azospirillum rugosum]MBP2297195.1 TRAP-type C4-dicarboxylate transport system substrate-binding protein [Azospirillum rugosum]MDQ0531039.1 TRAP-type C4-dicarboxylate transport system substrate-binding protein [Azospirillum rugosum]